MSARSINLGIILALTSTVTGWMLPASLHTSRADREWYAPPSLGRGPTDNFTLRRPPMMPGVTRRPAVGRGVRPVPRDTHPSRRK
jgi:hypothetical protein